MESITPLFIIPVLDKILILLKTDLLLSPEVFTVSGIACQTSPHISNKSLITCTNQVGVLLYAQS